MVLGYGMGSVGRKTWKEGGSDVKTVSWQENLGTVCVVSGGMAGWMRFQKKEYDYYISFVDSEQTRTVPFGYEPKMHRLTG